MENLKTHLIVSTTLSALVLTACVSNSTPVGFEPGRYASYRELLVATAGYAKFPTNTPQSVRDEYAQCAADFILSGVSSADLPRLNAYAQGRQDMPIGDLTRINADLEAKLGRPLTQGGLERLAPFCPEDMADIQKYPPRD